MSTYPILTKKQKKTTMIPVLNGGLNLRDALSNVNDNQLTDCNNLWFKDGMLRTRPGCTVSQVTEYSNNNPIGLKKHHVFSENGQLFSAFTKTVVDDESSIWIDFYWSGESESTIPRLILSTSDVTDNVTYFVIQQTTKLYCFVSPLCNIYSLDLSSQTEMEWVCVNQQDYYIPTIATNCVPSGSASETSEDLFSTGIMLEGYNLIGPYYRFYTACCNPDDLETFALYPLPFNVAESRGKTITVYLTLNHRTVKHTLEVPDVWVNHRYETTSHANDDQLRLGFFSGQRICFYDESGITQEPIDYVVHKFNKDNFNKNNVEIIAPAPLSSDDQNKVFRMTLNEWFGGGNAGYNGGTRLFLGGNDAPGEKNLVIWSGLNNPLYFDENCYFYVGTDATPVTAFGKQSDMLVIFKPNETYYTQYAQNTDITGEDLIYQTVVDYQANAVFFPLTLINSTIGCDCPGTVQLCRNRLTWLTSEGKLYSFVVANVYNERTIYEVGEMVYNDLRKYSAEDLKNATSADWQEYYLISIVDPITGKTKSYAMDYNSSGYQYPYSYSKAEDANKNIPWYRWTFDSLSAAEMISYDGDLCILYDRKNAELKHEAWKASVLRELDTDAGDLISVMMQTKIFDFLQGYRKDITKVGLSIGNNGGIPISISFITDAGTEEEAHIIDNDELDPRAFGYLTDFSMYPCIKSVLRFGVRLECDSSLSINGMTIQYKFLGGVR